MKNGQPEVILFVHGFGSSRKCWERMLELLVKDERIISRYEIATWDYPTKWVELNLLGRIPRLKELARSLGDEIDSPKYRGRPLTLVGHSQGGLIIQSYFAEQLKHGQASKLCDVRQAIFFATPSEGSTTGMSLRLLASTIFRNPQESTLRVLCPDVSDMRAVIRERIVSAPRDTNISWRIPIHAISGMQDKIVPEASARGPFDSVKRVKGNHFTIIKPKKPDDPRYTEFAELLLDPGGHSKRFEIENYETVIRVEPREEQMIHTMSVKNPRSVRFNNYATIRRTVRFACSNRCKNPFSIRYGTRRNGYVVGYTSHANEVSSAEKGRWEDTGTFFQFDFIPEYGKDYCLKVEIFNGFGEGERDVHFHLGDHSHYRRMNYVLDLSAYVAMGYTISKEPSFYLHPEDHEHGELCGSRRIRKALDCLSHTPEGIYCWELKDIRKAIVDIVWDLSPPGNSASLTVHDEKKKIEDGRAKDVAQP